MINGANSMTFEEAVEIMKSHSINGRSLLDGLEVVKELLRTDEDELTDKDKRAFRLVINKMRPLFY
jgi:hypothetical protein